MITPNQINSIGYENSLLANNLQMPEKSKWVYDESGGYNILDIWATQMVGPEVTAEKVLGANGTFETAVMGNAVIIATIKSVTNVTATTMRVVFTNPNYNNFRVNNVVGDGSAAMNQGLVYNTGAGFIDIRIAGSLTAFNTATMFLPGKSVLFLYNNQVIKGSVSPTSLWQEPDYSANQTSLIREVQTMYSADQQQAWMKTMDDTGEWYTSQDGFMLKLFAKQREYRGLWSQYGTDITAQGRLNYSMGLKDAIQNPLRGGTYKLLPNLMTQGDFETFGGTISDKRNIAKNSIKLLVGRGALAQIQSFANTVTQIQFSGTLNTLDGTKLDGFDTYTYALNGIHYDIIMCPMFNDPDAFPDASTIPGATARRMQYTMVAIDTESFPRAGGSGVLPPIRKKYMGAREINYHLRMGVGNGGPEFFGGAANLPVVDDTDAYSHIIYSNTCYDYICLRMGWLETI